MAKAAEQGVAMSRVIAFNTRVPNANVYPDRKWESPYVTNNSTFYQNDYINLEARTVFPLYCRWYYSGNGYANA